MRDHKMTLAAALFLLAAGARAEEAASFLRIGGGARAAAMGGAATAVSSDADAIFWNPAGLAGLERAEAGATHAAYLGDQYDSLAAAVPLGSRGLKRREESGSLGVIGVGLARMGYASQQGRDENRRPTGDFSASDYSAGVAYARRLPAGFSAGIAAKRVQSRLADASGGATALDAGASLDLGTRFNWRLGAAARNLGEDLRFSSQASPLPLTIAAGVASQPFRGLTLSGEVQRRPKSGKTTSAFGAEYLPHPNVALRAGYSRDGGPSGAAWPGGFTGGFGLSWSRLKLDYAVTPFGALGNVQTFSLSGRF